MGSSATQHHLCTIKASHEDLKIDKNANCSLADLRVMLDDFLYSPMDFFCVNILIYVYFLVPKSIYVLTHSIWIKQQLVGRWKKVDMSVTPKALKSAMSHQGR